MEGRERWRDLYTYSLCPASAVLTCRTMGSCCGGDLESTAFISHTWNADSC